MCIRVRDEQDEENLKEVREGVGVLERVRRVGVVEATAVGAHLLDDLLGGNRPAGDALVDAGQRGGIGSGGEVLYRAGRDQGDRSHDRQGQQDAQATWLLYTS